MTGDQHTSVPMTTEQLQAIHDRITSAWDMPGGFDVLYGDAETVVASDIYDLLEEVERLRAREAEWDSKEQALQKSLAEHGRVLAKIEARYEQQGQYNHQLVRRLVDALEIARAVAGMQVEGDIFDQPFYALMHTEHERDEDWHTSLITKARALLAQDEEQEAGEP